eukprot:3820406-Prymnesium_polylepis.1
MGLFSSLASRFRSSPSRASKSTRDRANSDGNQVNVTIGASDRAAPAQSGTRDVKASLLQSCKDMQRLIKALPSGASGARGPGGAMDPPTPSPQHRPHGLVVLSSNGLCTDFLLQKFARALLIQRTGVDPGKNTPAAELIETHKGFFAGLKIVSIDECARARRFLLSRADRFPLSRADR